MSSEATRCDETLGAGPVFDEMAHKSLFDRLLAVDADDARTLKI